MARRAARRVRCAAWAESDRDAFGRPVRHAGPGASACHVNALCVASRHRHSRFAAFNSGRSVITDGDAHAFEHAAALAFADSADCSSHAHAFAGRADVNSHARFPFAYGGPRPFNSDPRARVASAHIHPTPDGDSRADSRSDSGHGLGERPQS